MHLKYLEQKHLNKVTSFIRILGCDFFIFYVRGELRVRVAQYAHSVIVWLQLNHLTLSRCRQTVLYPSLAHLGSQHAASMNDDGSDRQ